MIKMDEKRLKQLDEYNLFRILEKASLGNLVRGSVWTVNQLSKLWGNFSKLAEEESKSKKKKAKTE